MLTIPKTCLATALAALVFSLLLSPTRARAQSTWSVYNYNTNGNLVATDAPASVDAAASFLFPTIPSAALLTTTSYALLLGNLTGKSLSASVSVSILSGAPVFTYNGEGASWNPCSVSANVRMFFSSDSHTYSPSKASQTKNETKYWWSNPVSETLTDQLSATMSVPLSGDQWSDANGHFGSDPSYAAGFAVTVANVRQIGLSFGGGCFFDVGVGIDPSTGSADLNLISETAG